MANASENLQQVSTREVARERRAFGATGFNVSPLGFGGAPIGYLETDRARVDTMLNWMLDQGINVIDTAASYEGSEEAIGRSVSHRRDEYVLVSKCGQTFPGLPGDAWSSTVIQATVDRSLKRLRTDRIDVVLLHSCDESVLEKGEALGALIALRDQGKVRFAGYSGDNAAAISAARLSDVAVIETSINICDQVNIEAVLPAARKRDLAVIAKRPIANAAWKPIEKQPGMYATYAQEYSRRLVAMGLTPKDLGYDGPPEEMWPEISLRFTLSQPGVHTAIVGTTNLEHLEANLAAVRNGPLPDQLVDQLRAAFQRARAASVEPWTGQT